ncbi:MAG: nucleotidyltransferase [Muricoprocola sp.]
MNITGIIAEYNPFHTGHAYHLEHARRITGADYIVVVMSGNYVQRGEPALIDKYHRTEMALDGGADLVLELPLRCACGSAEYFAKGAVSLLESLGCVTHLCFGSETTDLSVLEQAAALLTKEPEHYRAALQECLKKGYSFPKARFEALKHCITNLPESMKEPNSTLGIEYLKSLKQLDSSMIPVAIPRIGNGYHDHDLTKEFASATSLRSSILKSTSSPFPGLSEEMLDYLTASGRRILSENYQVCYPVCTEDFSDFLQYRLIFADSWEDFADIYDISEELAKRIFNLRFQYHGFDSFVQLLKTKNQTELHLRRALLHIILQLKKPTSKDMGLASYGRILGFKKESSPLLRLIKDRSSIPLISKMADAKKILSEYPYENSSRNQQALTEFEESLKASHLYESILQQKFSKNFQTEFQYQIVRR